MADSVGADEMRDVPVAAPASPLPSPVESPPSTGSSSAGSASLQTHSHPPPHAALSVESIHAPSTPASAHGASGVSPSPAVRESQQAQVAPSTPAPAADSAKSFAVHPPVASPQPQGESLGSTDGRDNREKQCISRPTGAQTSEQRTMLQPQPPQAQAAARHARSNMPAHAGRQNAASPDLVFSASSAPSAAASSRSSSSAVSAAAPAVAAPMHAASSAAASHTLPSGRGEAARPTPLAAAAGFGLAAAPPPSPVTLGLAQLSTNFKQLKLKRAAQLSARGPVTAPSDAAAAAAPAPSAGAAAVASSASESISALQSEYAGLLEHLSVHCLIVDRSHLRDAKDAVSLDNIMTSARPKVLSLLLAWLPALIPYQPTAAYVKQHDHGVRLLHVNLPSLAALSAALEVAPMLVRCGSPIAFLRPASAWKGPDSSCCAACGPLKQDLPELLLLRCALAGTFARSGSPQENKAEDLPTAIAALLASMHMPGAQWWMPSKARQRELFVYVLPRVAVDAALEKIMLRAHNKFTLRGSTVSVSAPNCAALAHCSSCDQLGHKSHACPRFSGRAVRLLFTEPISVPGLEALRQKVRARSAFFGSGQAATCDLPHRKVTMLFDVSDTDSAQVADLVARMRELTEALSHKLHEAPRVVDVARRHQECGECGFLPAQRTSSHTCPWPDLAMRQQQRWAALKQQASRPRSAPVDGQQMPVMSEPLLQPSAAARAPAAAHRDAMCSSWRKNKACPKLDTGRHCAGQHPAEHVVARLYCFDFAKGQCARAVCRYAHILPSPQDVTHVMSAAAAPASGDAAPPADAPPGAVDQSRTTAGLHPSPSQAASNGSAAPPSEAASAAPTTVVASPSAPSPDTEAGWKQVKAGRKRGRRSAGSADGTSKSHRLAEKSTSDDPRSDEDESMEEGAEAAATSPSSVSTPVRTSSLSFLPVLVQRTSSPARKHPPAQRAPDSASKRSRVGNGISVGSPAAPVPPDKQAAAAGGTSWGPARKGGAQAAR
jgi:hypothetical protein